MATRTGTPPSSRSGTAPRGGLWSRLWWILIVAFVLVIIIPAILAEMITDWMWFGSQGLAEVYTTRLWLSVGIFFGAGILSALLLYLNWRLAWRFARPTAEFEGQQEDISPRLVTAIILGVAAVAGLFFGLNMADEWSTILLYLNGVPFNQADPIFNNDISFYVFGLPLFRLLRGWLVGLVILSAIGTAAIYAVGAMPQIGRRLTDMQRRASLPGSRSNSSADSAFSLLGAFDGRAGAHLSVLLALFLALIGVGYWLDRYDLLYSTEGVTYGAGYTDVNARLPAYNIMIIVAAVMAVLLLVNIRFRTWKLLAGAVGVWLLAFVLVGGVYPWFVQQFQVRPSESAYETPYIQYNIAATRQAFGLDKFREAEVPAVQAITPEQVRDNADLVRNIRLWDYRPLQDTFRQLQVIRPYYTFNEPDIDRYTLNGKMQQVMLSAREINVAGLGAQQSTWENRHFRYTHGYGAVVSPVNEIVGEGLPRLLVRDIPPVADAPELQMTRPEIYYGEATDEYVFVNSQAIEEFDYPSGDDNVTTRYQGQGGVEVANFFTRLLFAIRFGDGNVLLTPYITEGTRVLFHRNIHDMVRTLAPFLAFDEDPYVVIADGKLYWIQDAYTYTSRYPYSTPDSTGLNYIRNSVKVVIDAYNGNTVFYVSDPTDPIVRAYRGIFPQLFKDLRDLPASLRAHLRYPEDLINVQARIYSTYHMTNPVVFYSKEDVWAIPGATDDSTLVPPEAYYVNMKLPNDPREGFMIIQPFTPRGRDNMIAWMAAKSDGEEYGQVEVIRYPKQQTVYGPRQIESRIDQDPVISQQLTLWNASGSQVLRGNLLTVPISNTVLYVEPLFLQATNGSFPELKRVIVATSDSVGIGADLSRALEVAFKLRPGEIVGADSGQPVATPVPGATPPPGGTPSVRTPAEITASALEHYNRAQQALQDNDWATYGREQELMKRDLDELARTYGVPTPTLPAGPTPPAATPSP